METKLMGVCCFHMDALIADIQLVKADAQGCLILLEALIQDSPFVNRNVYPQFT